MKDDNWNDDYSDAPFWKPQEEGDTLVGKCLGEATSSYETPTYAVELGSETHITLADGEEIELEAGDIVRVSYSTLSDFLELHTGDLVALEYDGENVAEKSQQEYKTFNKKWREVEE